MNRGDNVQRRRIDPWWDAHWARYDNRPIGRLEDPIGEQAWTVRLPNRTLALFLVQELEPLEVVE